MALECRMPHFRLFNFVTNKTAWKKAEKCGNKRISSSIFESLFVRPISTYFALHKIFMFHQSRFRKHFQGTHTHTHTSHAYWSAQSKMAVAAASASVSTNKYIWSIWTARTLAVSSNSAVLLSFNVWVWIFGMQWIEMKCLKCLFCDIRFLRCLPVISVCYFTFFFYFHFNISLQCMKI